MNVTSFNDYSLTSNHNCILKRINFSENNIVIAKKYIIKALSKKTTTIKEIPLLSIFIEEVSPPIMNIILYIGDDKLVEIAFITENKNKETLPYRASILTVPLCVSEWNTLKVVQTDINLLLSVNTFRAEMCFAFFDLYNRV